MLATVRTYRFSVLLTLAASATLLLLAQSLPLSLYFLSYNTAPR